MDCFSKHCNGKASALFISIIRLPYILHQVTGLAIQHFTQAGNGFRIQSSRPILYLCKCSLSYKFLLTYFFCVIVFFFQLFKQFRVNNGHCKNLPLRYPNSSAGYSQSQVHNYSQIGALNFVQSFILIVRKVKCISLSIIKGSPPCRSS